MELIYSDLFLPLECQLMVKEIFCDPYLVKALVLVYYLMCCMRLDKSKPMYFSIFSSHSQTSYSVTHFSLGLCSCIVLVKFLWEYQFFFFLMCSFFFSVRVNYVIRIRNIRVTKFCISLLQLAFHITKISLCFLATSDPLVSVCLFFSNRHM